MDGAAPNARRAEQTGAGIWIDDVSDRRVHAEPDEGEAGCSFAGKASESATNHGGCLHSRGAGGLSVRKARERSAGDAGGAGGGFEISTGEFRWMDVRR